MEKWNLILDRAIVKGVHLLSQIIILLRLIKRCVSNSMVSSIFVSYKPAKKKH